METPCPSAGREEGCGGPQIWAGFAGAAPRYGSFMPSVPLRFLDLHNTVNIIIRHKCQKADFSGKFLDKTGKLNYI